MIPGPDGWYFTSDLAAFHVEQQVAVIADVHLGYEWARAKAGDQLFGYTLTNTLQKLDRLLRRGRVARLVIAGDFVESSRPCPRTGADLRRLRGWLADRDVALTLITGNHDPQKPDPVWAHEFGGWTVQHGHRPLVGDRRIFGHFHPVLDVATVVAPCFLIDRNQIILPAFSPNAAGVSIFAGSELSHHVGRHTRCLAALGSTILDFGLVSELRANCTHSRSS